MKRDSWGSRIGFIFAVAGSAIGLGNIWRFPYITGAYGGGAFVILYLICLLLIGFPVLLSEILIGQKTQKSPGQAFQKLGGTKAWAWGGKMTILSGFLVSAFYSVVAGWIVGYLFEAITGQLGHYSSQLMTKEHFESLISRPEWTIGFHALFMSLAAIVLYFGVRKGIERGNKIMMPMLFLILIILVIEGLTMPNAMNGLSFLFSPDWSELTPAAFMIALGQSFFTLSIGQGTMVTYGSYLERDDNLVKDCIPVVLMDTAAAILAAMAIFTIVFSVGMQPDSGPGLLFQTLPVVFANIPGGYIIELLFFFLVFIAALSSEISALEPSIAYLIQEKGWTRPKAVKVVTFAAFLVGIPSALSFSVLKDYTIAGHSILGLFEFVTTSILIPVGGFLAVVLVGWRWGFHHALSALKEGCADYYKKRPFLSKYLWFCIKFSAPILILLVFLHALT